MIYIIFGVSGSGKSTIGSLLARKLNLKHFDADNYHPQTNIDKMRRGEPLDDEDRIPWLHKIGIEMGTWPSEGAVLSCSALKENYRKLLGGPSPGVKWILLDGDRDIIRSRLNLRKDHFFNVSLLDYQFKDLDIPEYALRFQVNQSPDEITELILKANNL